MQGKKRRQHPYWIAFCCLLFSCGGRSTSESRSSQPRSLQAGSRSFGALDDTDWTYIEAECIGRPIDLVSRGFEQHLRIRTHENGLLLVYDNTFLTEGCVQTIMRFAQPQARGNLWMIEEQARIALPATNTCSGKAENRRTGTLYLWGDALEVTMYQSGFCDGYDVRFAYRKVPRTPLTEHQLIRHYAAHFNRRDLLSIGDLFSESGVLLEPFAKTADGNYRRYEGRRGIRKFFTRVFGSAHWIALRLLNIEDTADPNLYIASWDYMDSNLEVPFSGRNLFVIASEQIFQTEIQVVSEVVETLSMVNADVLPSSVRGKRR